MRPVEVIVLDDDDDEEEEEAAAKDEARARRNARQYGAEEIRVKPEYKVRTKRPKDENVLAKEEEDSVVDLQSSSSSSSPFEGEEDVDGVEILSEDDEVLQEALAQSMLIQPHHDHEENEEEEEEGSALQASGSNGNEMDSSKAAASLRAHVRLSPASNSFYKNFSTCFPQTIPALPVRNLARFVSEARAHVESTRRSDVSHCIVNNKLVPVQWLSDSPCTLRRAPVADIKNVLPALHENASTYLVNNGTPLTLHEIVIPFISRIPTQITWIPLHKSVPTPDDRLLRYISYFGDHDNEDLFADVYTQEDVKTQGKNLSVERTALLYELDDVVLEQFFGQADAGSNAGAAAELELALRRESVPTSGGARGDKDEFEEDAGETFELRCTRVIGAMRKRDALPPAPAHRTRALVARESELMDSFRVIFCRVCLMYDCALHEKRPRELQTGSEFEWEVQCKSMGKDAIRLPPTSCGPKCVLNKHADSSALSPDQQILCAKLQVCLAGLASCCEIARVLKLDCFKVHHAIYHHVHAAAAAAAKTANADLVSLNLNGSSEFLAQQFASNKDFYQQFQKTQAVSETARKIDREIKSGILPESAHDPCMHLGPCGPGNPECSCQSNFCSKHCSCAVYCFQQAQNGGSSTGAKERICKNLFAGCQCVGANCRTKHCPCYCLSRACDPDLCHGGGVAGAVDAGCTNCVYTPIKLLLAESSVQGAGWGIFAANAVAKDAFISDYLGELITQEEAERRGRYCDKVNRSYLFNLNSDQVIDAFRKGNKIRFANHSKKPNCYVKMHTVDRLQHVFFFAKRDIKAGEELFFDYLWDQEQMTEAGDVYVAANTSISWYKKKSAETGDGGGGRSAPVKRKKPSTAAAAAAAAGDGSTDAAVEVQRKKRVAEKSGQTPPAAAAAAAAKNKRLRRSARGHA